MREQELLFQATAVGAIKSAPDPPHLLAFTCWCGLHPLAVGWTCDLLVERGTEKEGGDATCEIR